MAVFDFRRATRRREREGNGERKKSFEVGDTHTHTLRDGHSSSVMVGFPFWRTKRVGRTTPTNVKEEEGPRRHHDTLERSEMYAEVNEAVEMDKQRFARRVRRTLAFTALVLVTAAIVDIACHDNVRNWLETSFDWIEANPKSGESEREWSKTSVPTTTTT